MIFNQFVALITLKMKCKFVLLVFFGALAIGHNKPMSFTDHSPRGHQNTIWYVDRAHGIRRVITGDLNEFCQQLAADENSKRTVPKLYSWGLHSDELFYTCEVDYDASTPESNVGHYHTNTDEQTENIITSSEVDYGASTPESNVGDYYTDTDYKQTENIIISSDPTTDTSKLSDRYRREYVDAFLELYPNLQSGTSGPMESAAKDVDVTTAATPNSEGSDELIHNTTDQDMIYNDDINKMISEDLTTDEEFKKVMDPFELFLKESQQKVHESTSATPPTERTYTNGINQEPTTEPTFTLYKNIGEGYNFHLSVNGWMKLHVMPASWADARLRCLREGSTLASPVNLPMLNAMKDLLAKKVSIVYTGISENYAPGLFYSVEGVPLSSIPASFVSGQPDFQQGVEQCVSMFANGTMTLSRCDTLSSFICYVKDSDVPEIHSPCGQDPDYTFDSRTGQCYKFHTIGRTWSSAFMTCANEGGHLAIINSDVEAQVLVELVNKYAESKIRSDYPSITLLGFRDWSEHNTWMTIHGQTLQKAGYSEWGRGEPNDDRSEFCGAMFRSGKLNDTLCGKPMPFVCEKKPNVPLSSSNVHDIGLF